MSKRMSLGAGRPRAGGRVFLCRSFDTEQAETLARLRERFGLGTAAAVELAVRLRCGQAEASARAPAGAVPFKTVITLSVEADSMLRDTVAAIAERSGERVTMSEVIGQGLQDLESALGAAGDRSALRPLRRKRGAI